MLYVDNTDVKFTNFEILLNKNETPHLETFP